MADEGTPPTMDPNFWRQSRAPPFFEPNGTPSPGLGSVSASALCLLISTSAGVPLLVQACHT
jgi:hypothetical protein